MVTVVKKVCTYWSIESIFRQ